MKEVNVVPDTINPTQTEIKQGEPLITLIGQDTLNVMHVRSTQQRLHKRDLNEKYGRTGSRLERCASIFYLLYLIFFVSIIFMQFDVEKRYKMRQTLRDFFVDGKTEEIIIKEDIHKPLTKLSEVISNLLLDDKYEIASPIRITQRRIKIDPNPYPITPLVTDKLNSSRWASSGIGYWSPYSFSREENVMFADLFFLQKESFLGQGGYVSYLTTLKLKPFIIDLNEKYIDSQTACVTIDVLLINYELNYTCSVAIKNEFDENGVIKKQFYLHLLNRNLYSADWEYARATFELIALLSLIAYFVFYIMSLVNKVKGIRAYHPTVNPCKIYLDELVLNVFNLFQLISILLSIIMIIIWCAFTALLKQQSSTIEAVFTQQVVLELPSMNDIFYCGYVLEVYRGFATLNFFFIFARLVEIICKLIPSTSVFVDTISSSMSDIFSYFIFFLCLLLGFSVLSWIFFCRWLESFSSFNLSFQQNWVFSLGIMNSGLFYEMYDKDSPMAVIYFLVFIVCMRFFINKIVLGIILFYFNKVNGTYLMEQEMAFEDEFTESNIKKRPLYKVVLSYSRLVNTLCDWVICKCRRKREMAVEVDYSDVGEFGSWTIKHYLCPELKVKSEVMKDDKGTELEKIRKISGMQLYQLNYDENFEFTARNAYFDSEKDFEKVKCYFEMKYRKTVKHSLLYFVFTIFLIVMYLMNCLTPWRWNFYSYLGDTLNATLPSSTSTSTIKGQYSFHSEGGWNSSLLNQFVFEDFLKNFVDRIGPNGTPITKAFLGNNFVLGNKLLITTKRQMKEQSFNKSITLPVRRYEILNDYKLYQEDKAPLRSGSFSFPWDYYASYNGYGGYGLILNFTKIGDYAILKDDLLNYYTAFTYIEFFLQNYEYQVGIYVKIKVTSDYGAYYIQDYQTNLIKYNTLQLPLDGAKYASEFFFLVLLIYLIALFFRNIIRESRNYNKWYHDVIVPLNLKIKDLRNKAEPELLRKISYMISMPRILDLSIICLSIALIGVRIHLWVNENKLNTRLIDKAYGDDDSLYALRDLFYSAIYAKNNYEIIGCFVIFLSLIKYIILLDFGQYLSVLKRTFENSQYNNWTFILILIVIHPAFVFYAHLSFGEKTIQYYKVESSILSIAKILCGYITYMDLENANLGFGPLFYFIYLLIVNMILLNLFVSIISVSYDKIKESISKSNDVWNWSKVLCFCTRLRYKKEQVYTLEAEFEYDNQIPKYDTGLHITSDKKTVLEWVKYESDQMRRLDDTLFAMKKKKNDMDLAIETSKAEQEFVFEDNLYKNIQYSHFRSFYVFYLNFMLTIPEMIENDINLLDQSTKHLAEHDEYMNYDKMLENVTEKHNKILRKIAEIDKNFIDMKNDLNQIHSLAMETFELEKEAKKKKLSEKKSKEGDDPPEETSFDNNIDINSDDSD